MRLALATAALAALILSCRSQVEHTVNPKPSIDVHASDTHVPQFSDVPVPESFTVRKDRLESYVAEAGLWRSGRLLYAGSGSMLDAIAYFEERLPHHGWTLVDRNAASAASHLVFRKADSSARLDLKQGARRDMLDLEVRVTTSRSGNLVAAPASAPADENIGAR